MSGYSRCAFSERLRIVISILNDCIITIAAILFCQNCCCLGFYFHKQTVHRSNSEEDTYFQLWTKCRGWSQSKPAENAVRGTGVEISDGTRWIINFHSTSAHPPPVESKALFSTCFQESLNGIVTVGRGGGLSFLFRRLVLKHKVAVDSNSTLSACGS